MAKRQKRDIYRGRHDPGFDIERDVDLEHLRSLLGPRDDLDGLEYDFLGLYLRNIGRIMMESHWFRGYGDDVKEDMLGEALIDMLKARRKFNGNAYPQRTAPFSYMYRIGFHSCQHVLANYYLMQNRMTPASRVGAGTCLMDSSDEFSDDILEKAVNDWEEIELNLRGAMPATPQSPRDTRSPSGRSSQAGQLSEAAGNR